ncbi:MAG: heme exporter protein CcmB [Alphaproteobacteria bacterium]|jgi:heme exporter protein B|nr:MAG: Heme exporter protein B [Alphaproteobacteria bacterium MarineAlpha9_Bin5]HHZ67565.1 heme exporter protein CcmB [Alphaproteobacteria bacterium]HIA21674.1 heme exporter protein CcmB [Alphaproteobacteria bacterium]HIB18154.1 heme exporter protein CcmB [Alphaproteobacteria bacterium]HIB56453.1 heme exporter protein CcmB [Alphaproteobacteria bacterium]
MNAFIAIVRRDVTLALRRVSDTVSVVLFFVLAIVLFPLGIGPELNVLARIAAGTIWVAALLAAMLSLDRLFQVDADEGGLDLLVLAPLPLEAVVLAKCLAHWLVTGVPLILSAPILSILLNMGGDGFLVMILAMALATPTLSLIGAVGAALTVGARRGGVLVSLLVLPLLTPVLILGASAVDLAVAGLNATPLLMLLGAMLLVAVLLCPWAAAAGLRLATE